MMIPATPMTGDTWSRSPGPSLEEGVDTVATTGSGLVLVTVIDTIWVGSGVVGGYDRLNIPPHQGDFTDTPGTNILSRGTDSPLSRPHHLGYFHRNGDVFGTPVHQKVRTWGDYHIVHIGGAYDPSPIERGTNCIITLSEVTAL